MSKDRRRRLDRHTAERLLHGVSGHRGAGEKSLAELLAAASAPSQPRELLGEEAAMAAFRAAHLGTPLVPSRRPTIWVTARRLLTLKVAAGVAAVTVAATAFAASSGVIPSPFDKVPERAPGSSPTSASGSPSGHDSGGPATTPATGIPPGLPTAEGLRGLCEAYFRQPVSAREKSLESPAFAALVTAAGDADRVDPYCTTLLATPPAGQPTAHPTGPPSVPPGDAPSVPPTEQPTKPPKAK